MLSEKAQGKRKAVDSELHTPIASSSNLDDTASAHHNLVVRFSEGLADVMLEVRDEDNINDLKLIIRREHPELASNRLRFIHSGTILPNDLILKPWLDNQRRKSETPSDEPTVWIHCSVGPQMQSSEEEEDKQQVTQIKPARGFDRLAQAGLSESDIANIRRQFHSQSMNNFLDDDLDFESDEAYEEHARELEERWIDSLDGRDSGISGQIVPSTSLMQGLASGFFFPLIPFFFMSKPQPPVFWENGRDQEASESVVFSRKTQIGIVAGFLLNFIFGLWRALLDGANT